MSQWYVWDCYDSYDYYVCFYSLIVSKKEKKFSKMHKR